MHLAMKRSILRNTMVVSIIALMGTACSKNENDPDMLFEGTAQQAASEVALDLLADQVVEQIDAATLADEELLKAATPLKSAYASYPIVSVTFPERGAWPRIVTIDYGPENVTIACHKNETIQVRGKVTIEKTGPHFETGSIRSVTTDGFYVNDHLVEMVRSFTQQGVNGDGNYVVAVRETLKVTAEDESWHLRNVEHLREMVAGAFTKTIWDDEFETTGQATLSHSSGWVASRVITEPLYRLRSCRFPISGKVAFSSTGGADFSLDYGTGQCDAAATLILADGSTREIVLGRNR